MGYGPNYFHDRSILGRYFRGFVLPVLEYCSAVWCSAADTHLKLLDRAVSGSRFLTGGVFECDIYHRRSMAVLCMLYRIRCNQVHPLSGALHWPYVPVRVTRGALLAHRYTYAPPRCRTLQYSRTCIPFSVVFPSSNNYYLHIMFLKFTVKKTQLLNTRHTPWQWAKYSTTEHKAHTLTMG